MKNSNSNERENAENSPERKNGLLNRRNFLQKIFAGSVVMAIGLALPEKAKANEYEIAPFQEILNGKELAPEKMDLKEMLIMDEAMHVLFKKLNHFSLWSGLISTGRDDEFKKAVITVMDAKNRDKFWYKKNNDGVITIVKRKADDPDVPAVSIAIKYNEIININGYAIDYDKLPIRDFNEEWRELDEQVLNISSKVLTAGRYNDPETGKTPIIVDWEYAYYSQYSMQWPRTILLSLQLKGDLTQTERKVKNELEDLLKSHPYSMKDILESSKKAEQMNKPELIKVPTMIVLKRKEIKMAGQKATPLGVFEFAKYGGGAGAWTTFAYVSKEGKILEKKGSAYVPSDRRSKPFAESMGSKTGLIENEK